MEEKGEPYKVELIQDLPEDAEISFYSQGGDFAICARGPHLMSTKAIKAFKLMSSSGAYWRGDEKNKMLSRIYGTAFAKKDELNAYLEQMEEAKKRDHNKLGREMELFTTVDVIGQGLPLLMPKGVIVIKELQRWIEDLEDNEWDYIRTKTPLMAKSRPVQDLRSLGSLQRGYVCAGRGGQGQGGICPASDDLSVPVLRIQGETAQLPGAAAALQRESTLFRNEDSGEMHGLTRVRQFTISEGHLIVRPDQMMRSSSGCVELAKYCLRPWAWRRM